jgi:hypothetical protein
MRSKGWLEQHDHRRTEEDYKRWRDQHFSYLQSQMQSAVNALAKGIHPDAPAAVIAGVTGVSDATVRRLIKKQIVGSRGPTLRTYLALKAMGRTEK